MDKSKYIVLKKLHRFTLTIHANFRGDRAIHGRDLKGGGGGGAIMAKTSPRLITPPSFQVMKNVTWEVHMVHYVYKTGQDTFINLSQQF